MKVGIRPFYQYLETTVNHSIIIGGTHSQKVIPPPTRHLFLDPNAVCRTKRRVHGAQKLLKEEQDGLFSEFWILRCATFQRYFINDYIHGNEKNPRENGFTVGQLHLNLWLSTSVTLAIHWNDFRIDLSPTPPVSADPQSGT